MLYADNAMVLPKGRTRFNVTSTFYFPVHHRYSGDSGEKGDVEDIATDFNARLDSSLFPDLSALETGFGLPAGFASLGNSLVDFEYKYNTQNYRLQYGITDRLTAGVDIPYIWQKNKVKSSLDTSKATIGKSVTGAGLGVPLVPLAGGGPFGDAVPLTTEDMKDILGGGLDINGNGTIDVDGFGYKRFKTWSQNGIGDIETGFRYQYLKTKNWRLAANLGAGFPTGEIDDPDNLVDYAFFTFGAYRILGRLNADFMGIKNNIFNTTLRYDLVLPKKEELRIRIDPNNPLSDVSERVDRDIGDIVQIEVYDRYSPFKGFNISVLYNFTCKYKNDRISGDMDVDYTPIEEETAFKSHNVIIGLSYSTIPKYMDKKFPIPLKAYLSYRNKFAGRNNSMKSQYISFGLDIFF